MESAAALNPPQNLPHRIFVISDLHLGGEYPPDHQVGRGFRICTQTARLSAFIRQVAQIDGTPSTCELVINGDFLDFLAEKPEVNLQWQPFITDGERAAKKLSDMIDRDRNVFDSLKDLLAAGHRLTILLGNHDVELSLPPVRQLFERVLETEGKHFRFISDNQAYVIGPVIIEHGNRYDGWNVIDHDGLRRMRSAQSRKEKVAPERGFTPPAGSVLVASVMNRIKKCYPFVDLLKPEDEATLPLLLTLAPQYRKHVMTCMVLRMQAELHSPNSAGQPRFKSEIAAGAMSSPEEQLRQLLAKHVSDSDVKEFEKLIKEATPPRLYGTENEIAFNVVTGFKSLLTRFKSLLPIVTTAPLKPLAARLPALLTALRTLEDERSTIRSKEHKIYLGPAQDLISRGYKVVVFGHTHLAKNVCIEKKDNKGIYLNTGTWADLIQFPYDQLNQKRKQALEWLGGFVSDMEKGEMEQYILKKPTYARIELDNEETILHADIHDFMEGRPII